jgi:hypothetical protein
LSAARPNNHIAAKPTGVCRLENLRYGRLESLRYEQNGRKGQSVEPLHEQPERLRQEL